VKTPFDTGIRLTVANPDPTRVHCDVDEFVLCPTNARADEWQRLAETEARDHLATIKRLVEGEVVLAQAERARDLAQTMQRMAEAFHDVAIKERDLARHHAREARHVLAQVAAAMACEPASNGDLIEAVRLLVEERDAERDAHHATCDAPDLDNLARLAALDDVSVGDAAEVMNALPALLADHARLVVEVAWLTADRDSYANSDFERQLDAERAEVARLRGLVEEACSYACDSANEEGAISRIRKEVAGE
jgi:rubrerythrin